MSSSLAIETVHLRVSNLRRSLQFYTRQLGFVALSEQAVEARLATISAGRPLLTLTEQAGVSPAPRDAAGLFHAALRLPDRPALGAWLARAATQGVAFDGFADHGVSEAVYLSDPDGIGLEFYIDRPRSEWPFVDGELAMTTDPLAVPDLLAAGRAIAGKEMAPLAGAHWGHLHLRVTGLERSEAFYRSALGLDVTQTSYPGARFLAADGYHHHVGLNCWGQPRRPAPSEAAGLVEAALAHRGTTVATTLTDPDGMRIRLVPLPAPTA